MFQYEQSIYYFIIIAQLRDSIYLHYRPENYFTKKEKKKESQILHYSSKSAFIFCSNLIYFVTLKKYLIGDNVKNAAGLSTNLSAC